MTSTRAEVLETIRERPLEGTPRLVELGPGHPVQFERGVPSHGRDIDFWAAMADRDSVTALFAELGAVRISRCSSRIWANHDVYLVRCADGDLLIDIKFGDLMVGPLTLLGEAELLASVEGDGRFSGAAEIADLMLRRLARGKQVDSERLERAGSAWQGLTTADRGTAIAAYAKGIGTTAANAVRDLLEGREPPHPVEILLRRRVWRSYFSGSAAFAMAMRKALVNVVGKLTLRARPFGQYQHGTLTVISGTDGTGKSTTLETTATSLRSYGMRCKTVYLGRGRGNVPGVATLRNAVAKKVTASNTEKDVYRVSIMNKLACWLYAVEYVLRTLWPRFLAGVLGCAVICDRYCYDIALIRNGSPWALRFARLLCPTPDINVVLYAPPEVILDRKAERGLKEIEKQQAILAEIIDGAYARRFSLRIDTSAAGVNETRNRIVHPILQLSHRDY